MPETYILYRYFFEHTKRTEQWWHDFNNLDRNFSKSNGRSEKKLKRFKKLVTDTYGKRPGSAKKSKTADLKIHKVETIEPENIPAGSVFREYRDFVVQDIILELCNTQYRLKVYETADGKLISGKLP